MSNDILAVNPYWSRENLQVLHQQSLTSESANVRSRREQIYQMLQQQGWPNKNWQTWRFFNWQKLIGKEIETWSQSHPIDSKLLPFINDAINIVVVDGVLNTSLSQLKDLPEGVNISALSQNSSAYERSVDQVEFESQPLVQVAVSIASAGLAISIADDVKW